VVSDGEVYDGAKLLRIEPDGLVIEYSPPARGTGMAKLKFTRLPESLQKQFSYDPQEGSDFEKRQALAMAAMREKLQKQDRGKALRAEIVRDALVPVQISSPAVTYTYYDPAGPKPSCIADGMDACTRGDFKCVLKSDLDDRAQGSQSQSEGFSMVEIKSARIALELLITIVLPEHATEGLKAHEEGHRKINEHFYALGARAVERAVEQLSEEISLSATNAQAAKGAALSRALSAARREVVTYGKIPGNDANAYYDELTDHGRNRIQSDDAVRQAIERFQSPSVQVVVTE